MSAEDHKLPEVKRTRMRAFAECIAQGMSRTAAAKKCRVSDTTVRSYLRDPECRALIDELKLSAAEEAKDRLAGLVAAAVSTHVSVMMVPNEQVPPSALPALLDKKLAAARSILDRAGIVGVQKVETKSAVLHLTPRDLAGLTEKQLEEFAATGALPAALEREDE